MLGYTIACDRRQVCMTFGPSSHTVTLGYFNSTWANVISVVVFQLQLTWITLSWCTVCSGLVRGSRQRTTRRTSDNRRTRPGRTVCVRLSTTLHLWRRASLWRRLHVTCRPLWRPRRLERLPIHLRPYVTCCAPLDRFFGNLTQSLQTIVAGIVTWGEITNLSVSRFDFVLAPLHENFIFACLVSTNGLVVVWLARKYNTVGW